jgi:hypothetical protein
VRPGSTRSQTEAFLRFENPTQVTAAIAHPDFSGDSHDVILINALNEAQRLNASINSGQASGTLETNFPLIAVSDVPDVTG